MEAQQWRKKSVVVEAIHYANNNRSEREVSAEEWWNANSSRFIDDKDWWDMPVVLDAFAKEKVRAAVKECLRIAKAEGDTPLEEGGNVSRWDACDNVIREIKARFAEELK